MKKFIIISLFLPLFVFADIAPQRAGIDPDTRGIIFQAPNSVEKLPPPESPQPPETPSVPSESSNNSSGGSFLVLSREELRWLANPVIDLNLVSQTEDGLIKVSKNYAVHPDFISYGGYQLAKEFAR